MLCKKTLLNTPEQKGILSFTFTDKNVPSCEGLNVPSFSPDRDTHTDAKSGCGNLLVKKVKVTLTYMYMYTHWTHQWVTH